MSVQLVLILRGLGPKVRFRHMFGARIPFRTGFPCTTLTSLMVAWPHSKLEFGTSCIDASARRWHRALRGVPSPKRLQ